jgi:hypothetical protein
VRSAINAELKSDALFDEEWYLTAYPDVAKAVKTGGQISGRAHYLEYGYKEARCPIPPPQRYLLSLCAIVRNEGPYLLEWIAFHWAVGVEHFYIYDNESKDGTSNLLDHLHRLGLVTRISWPDDAKEVIESGIGPQVPAYNDFLRYSYETKWVGFVDLDEFVVPIGSVDLRTWFQRSNQKAVGINWRMFGSSGLLHYEDRLVIERFTRRAQDDFPPNRHIKTFAVAREIERANCHISHLKHGDVVDVQGVRVDPALNGVHERCVNGDLQINHYFTRSKEEWTSKRNRGRATKATTDMEKFRSPTEFAFYDRNEVTDTSALRFAEETRKNMAAIRQLIRSNRS